jgi:hypothetical protein
LGLGVRGLALPLLLGKEEREMEGEVVIQLFLPSSPVVGRRGTEGDEGLTIKSKANFQGKLHPNPTPHHATIA